MEDKVVRRVVLEYEDGTIENLEKALVGRILGTEQALFNVVGLDVREFLMVLAGLEGASERILLDYLP